MIALEHISGKILDPVAFETINIFGMIGADKYRLVIEQRTESATVRLLVLASESIGSSGSERKVIAAYPLRVANSLMVVRKPTSPSISPSAPR